MRVNFIEVFERPNIYVKLGKLRRISKLTAHVHRPQCNNLRTKIECQVYAKYENYPPSPPQFLR